MTDFAHLGEILSGPAFLCPAEAGVSLTALSRALESDRGESWLREFGAARMSLPSTLEATEHTKAGYTIVDRVGVIPVSGMLFTYGYRSSWDGRIWSWGYDIIQEAAIAAQADERVDAIVIIYDTPGGVVDGCRECADALLEMSGRNDGKPMISFTQTRATSAGYFLACASDEVIAGPLAKVGSLGAVFVHSEEAGLLRKAGVTVTGIESGKHKTAGAYFKKLDADARARIQAYIDDSASALFEFVAAARGQDEGQYRSQEADVFWGEHAVEQGLVDEIGTIQDALARATELGNGGGQAAAAPTAEANSDVKATSHAAAASKKETATMGKKLKAALLGILGDKAATASAEDTIEKIRNLLNEDDDAEANSEEDEAEANDDDEAEANSEEDEAEANDDEDEAEASANGDSAQAADPQTLLGRKSAKRNMPHAVELAFTPGMTTARFDRLMKSAAQSGGNGEDAAQAAANDVQASSGSSGDATEADALAAQILRDAGMEPPKKGS
ncbi:S49 family peptidase [Maricaulis maris]|uniref:S49 family peptidase n=1 Tax=Maricaulis maris TaxID=74318 RepID=UPI003B8E0EA7